VSAVVVADASPLIAFQQIGQLQLLRTMFGEVTVPPAVAREILPSVPFAPWIVERRLTQPIAPLVLRANLGAGESEALSLAVEIRADLLFVDERAGRRVAAALGPSVVGTLGVILAAKRTGHIAEVRPVVDELLRQGFWVAPRLVKQALSAAAEEGPDGSRS
jgi:predicted nucleic acid-binding protein